MSSEAQREVRRISTEKLAAGSSFTLPIPFLAQNSPSELQKLPWTEKEVKENSLKFVMRVMRSQKRVVRSYLTGWEVMRARPEQNVGAALPSQTAGARSPTSRESWSSGGTEGGRT